MITTLSKLRFAKRRTLTTLAFNTAKIRGKGEDADPLLDVHGDALATLGVFDGLGGSGSLRCGGTDGIRTSAYYAARVARDSAGAFLRSAAPFADVTPEALAAVLGQHLTRDLRAYDAEWGRVGGSALRSTLFRRLPTTAAIAVVRPRTTAAHATVLWAGDSRCFVLSPAAGLQQLTIDHLRTPSDPLANLTNDSSISNCITADDAFYIDARAFALPTPCIVIAATDGCFGYVSTPMHFEALLLAVLVNTRSAAAWQARLRERIAGVAADDASLALLALGWSTHRALRRSFGERFRFVQETYVDPLDQATDPAALRVELWNHYRVTYEALQPKEGPCAAT
jgi:serine/threonine protein phosphatase PrpC